MKILLTIEHSGASDTYQLYDEFEQPIPDGIGNEDEAISEPPRHEVVLIANCLALVVQRMISERLG